MHGSPYVQHSSYIRPSRHLKRRIVSSRRRGRQKHFLDGRLQRQDVLDQSSDVLRYSGVVLLDDRLSGLQGGGRDQIAVVPVVWSDRGGFWDSGVTAGDPGTGFALTKAL